MEPQRLKKCSETSVSFSRFTKIHIYMLNINNFTRPTSDVFLSMLNIFHVKYFICAEAAIQNVLKVANEFAILKAFTSPNFMEDCFSCAPREINEILYFSCWFWLLSFFIIHYHALLNNCWLVDIFFSMWLK